MNISSLIFKGIFSFLLAIYAILVIGGNFTLKFLLKGRKILLIERKFRS